MAHLAFDYQPDHDFIAAQIDADIAAEKAGAAVIHGPWTTHPAADTADTTDTR